MADVKLIPLEVLLGHPERAAAQISPDGRRLSYLAPLDGVLNVFVGDAGAGNERPVTHDTGRGIEGYLWAHDNRHLMYVRDKDGSENYPPLRRRPRDGRGARPHADRRRAMPTHRPPQASFPNDVLIGFNKDNPQLHDVYHLDLTTGKLREDRRESRLSRLGGRRRPDGARRGRPTPDGGAVILVRDDESSDWRPLLEVAAGGCGDDRAARLHQGRHGHVPADVRRLEHRPAGEDGHRDRRDRGDRRGPGLRHHRRDHATPTPARSRA